MIPKNSLLNATDLEEIKTICLCISIPYYFTLNNMYKTQRSSNKTWIRKDQRVITLQNHIETEIHSLRIRIPEDIYCYSCSAAFCSSKYDWLINDGSKLRVIDLSNLWKAMEDSIFRGLGIDDSFAVHVSLNKCILPKQLQSPPHFVAISVTFYKLRRKVND